MLDFIRPRIGSEIEILGMTFLNHPNRIKQRITYLSGDVAAYEKMKATEYFSYILDLNHVPGKKHKERYMPYVETFNFKENLRRKIKTLSRGNKQKVAVIAALMLEPELLIMDEPTSGLDPLMQEEFYKVLRKMKKDGKTVFMSSHFLPEIEKVCDRAAIIKEGKIVSIEDIDELGKKGLVNIEVTTKPDLKEVDFKKIKEVVKVKKIDGTSRITVKGSPDKIIKALAKYSVEAIEIKHADLEQIFMEFYNV
jgi:ABC-2 type transport system ATP-binding protein